EIALQFIFSQKIILNSYTTMSNNMYDPTSIEEEEAAHMIFTAMYEQQSTTRTRKKNKGNCVVAPLWYIFMTT
ncbi:unnamed protein product, partial [Prunus brigantina]